MIKDGTHHYLFALQYLEFLLHFVKLPIQFQLLVLIINLGKYAKRLTN